MAALTHSINTDTWGTTGISRDVLAGVRALGQEVQELAPYTETAFTGFAIGIGRDGRSGPLSGNLQPYINGAGLGY